MEGYTPGDPGLVGRSVIFRSFNGNDMPAIITATSKTFHKTGMEQAGEIPALTDDNRVHLTCFSPAKGDGNGTQQVWDVPLDDEADAESAEAGTARLELALS